MADVYNWQLGRPMTYRFAEAHPKWQFAAVFNINRCIACQTCTMACKSTWTFSEGQELMWWNNVETKPYGGYPHHWDVNTLKLLDEADPGGQKWAAQPPAQDAPYGTYAGKTIFEAAQAQGKVEEAIGYLPTDDQWTAPNIFEDTPRNRGDSQLQATSLPEHRTWFFYLQRICNHCTYPACLAACPRNAIYKRPEDGIVLIDEERCRGYRKCAEQCPYKKPMFRSTTRVSEKCIGCYPRVEGTDPLTAGLPMETRCMSACVGKIRLQGLVEVGQDGKWVIDQDSPLYYMVREEQIALPLYPQFGTEPNIYYIPPRWVPRTYLHQMFGPGVEQAIDRYAMPSRRLQAVLQLFRTTQRIIFKFSVIDGEKVGEMNVGGKTLELFNDTVVGYDRNGIEVVRQSVMEPVHDRGQGYWNTI
ncbi:MAG: nitrate oxidoreductase subunit beta [Dehalococcoidia bacterium]|nr:MAG: nitrate oxidoreductase subunit beta [Dehalococcoidia bacterium]